MKKNAAIFCLLFFLTAFSCCAVKTAISGKYDPEGVLKNADCWNIAKDSLESQAGITKSAGTYQLKKSVPFINDTGYIAYAFDENGNLKIISYTACNVDYGVFKEFCSEYNSAFSENKISIFVLPKGEENNLDWNYLKTISEEKDKSFICSGTWFDSATQINTVYSYMSGGSPSIIVTISKGE